MSEKLLRLTDNFISGKVEVRRIAIVLTEKWFL